MPTVARQHGKPARKAKEQLLLEARNVATWSDAAAANAEIDRLFERGVPQVPLGANTKIASGRLSSRVEMPFVHASRDGRPTKARCGPLVLGVIAPISSGESAV
jgi:hypothetical protein